MFFLDSSLILPLNLSRYSLNICISAFQNAEQEYEREKLNERIAKLSGGVAVIQVHSELLKYLGFIDL